MKTTITRISMILMALMLSVDLPVQADPPSVQFLPGNNRRDKTVRRRGGNARKNRLKIPEKHYDPNTTVVVDALWMRVHEENCPSLILKEHKDTMTLEEADKQGYRIGESGQSGRGHCCFKGYRRKYPMAVITGDTIVSGNDNKRHRRHLAGCHRYWPSKDHKRMPRAEWEAQGYNFCAHCVERGPSRTTISDEQWQQMGDSNRYEPPAGWEPMPFSWDTLPPKSEIDILANQVLNSGVGIQELPFDDPVARAEQFVTMRFFFPVGNWLKFYKAYRGTGDERILEKLRESARYYNQLSRDFPSVAQSKAYNPEGWSYLYSMAVSSRITLQLARKSPDQVSSEELAEAEEFLTTIAVVLSPALQGNSNLDPQMGIPQPTADDFRQRSYNRAMNGIGTLAMATAALEDLQALQGGSKCQSTITRYRKAVKGYMENFRSIGYFSTEIPGKPIFVYPYHGTHKKIIDGTKIYGRYEDSGHYSHLLQGLMLVHDATPELGADDEMMTAVANAIHFNNTTKIKRKNREEWSGHIQCPVSKRVAPQGGENIKRHAFKKGPGSKRFYMLEGFRDGLIDALNTTANESQKVEAAKNNRVEILHVHYLKALRKDPSLIHLGEVM